MSKINTMKLVQAIRQRCSIKNSRLLTRGLGTSNNSYLKGTYDVVIIGAGHNGLISAAYLSKAGYEVCVLEKRKVIGGAAVTEEIVPGFKFSRASYVLSLLRPHIIRDLRLKEHGLKWYRREPYSSYTPIHESYWSRAKARSLLLSSSDLKLSQEQISQFSTKDAAKYAEYEDQMSIYVKAINHLIDERPPKPRGVGLVSKLKEISSYRPVLKTLLTLGSSAPDLHYLLSTSAEKYLESWFESEPLMATLATDAVIGTMSSPRSKGTGYVLLHHIMGGVDGSSGSWVYPESGMGAVSHSIANSAIEHGAHICTNKEVDRIRVEMDGSGKEVIAVGVITKDGHEVRARKGVFSGTTPHVTFKDLLDNDPSGLIQEALGHDFSKALDLIDYTSPVTKINVALNSLPNFSSNPNPRPNHVQALHKCTIHLNCESIDRVVDSYESSRNTGQVSDRPMIEMVLPSSLDRTLAPEGSHVCLLFTQYTPYSPSNGSWADPEFRAFYADKVFDTIEEYAPGFKKSIVGWDLLSPPDLEKTFGLTGGNIFHGAMSVDQLFWLRPFLTPRCWFPETPINQLYLCGSGIHSGGGVMGTPGYLAAKAFLERR